MNLEKNINIVAVGILHLEAKSSIEGMMLIILLKLIVNTGNYKRTIIKMWTSNGAHIRLV